MTPPVFNLIENIGIPRFRKSHPIIFVYLQILLYCVDCGSDNRSKYLAVSSIFIFKM